MKILFAALLFYYKSLVSFSFLFGNKNRTRKNNILFFENFPVENAGYQYRAAKWKNYLEAEGFKVDVWTIVESKAVFDNYMKYNRLGFMILSMRKRFRQILRSRSYETVIVRRELLLYNDYGKLFMEKFLLKLHPNAILDFDDDIAASKKQPKKITNFYGKLLLEDGNKFNNTLRLYKRFIVASDYLKQKVLAENPNILEENVLVIPTCVDYNQYPIKEYPQKIERISFGWIGGAHNYFLLDTLIPTLNKLIKTYSFKLIVIGGAKYDRNTDFPIEFIPWSLDTEVENLYKIDVGLMPLKDDARSRGKGGFKLIQYMGLGIVSVASAITINCEIVDNELNSFLAKTDEDWETILKQILENKVNFKQISTNARASIEKRYTFDAIWLSYKSFVCLNQES